MRNQGFRFRKIIQKQENASTLVVAGVLDLPVLLVLMSNY